MDDKEIDREEPGRSFREIGRELLEKLKQMGPDLSMVGKTIVITRSGQSFQKSSADVPRREESGEEASMDEEMSMARYMRQLRAMKNSELRAGQKKDGEDQIQQQP